MVPTKPRNGKNSYKLSTVEKPSLTKVRKQKPGQGSKVSKSSTPPQVKTKPAAFNSNKPVSKNPKTYTDKELGIPHLNMTRPAGSEKPKGKKKGKMFIDDQASMMTILAMVNAEKEGQIESKIMKARQMEEIRQARENEAEARQRLRKAKLEETKNTIRRKRPRNLQTNSKTQQDECPSVRTNKIKKQASFY